MEQLCQVWRLFVVWQNNALAVLPSLFTFAGDFGTLLSIWVIWHVIIRAP